MMVMIRLLEIVNGCYLSEIETQIVKFSFLTSSRDMNGTKSFNKSRGKTHGVEDATDAADATAFSICCLHLSEADC